MQKGYILEFTCQSCHTPVAFPLFDLEQPGCSACCDACHQQYRFEDAILQRQLKKFAALCKQLVESEEILSNASVGIDLGEHHVKVPYKILLTRLNPVLDLVIGDQPLSIRFRIEPAKEAKYLV